MILGLEAACVLACCCLALREFLFLYNHVCGVDLLSVTIRVAAGLDTSGNRNFRALTQILLSKLSLTSECHTADEISGCLSVSPESSVYCQCISRKCARILTL